MAAVSTVKLHTFIFSFNLVLVLQAFFSYFFSCLRSFRCDLNQIPYDYTVEVTNRFKGLDLIDRVPEELRMEVCDTVQEAVIKTITKKKKCEKAKWLSNSCEKKR